MASIISAGTTSGTALNMTADTTGALQLATNSGTTAVTIDTSQNVGIGTTSPTDSDSFGRTIDAVGTNGAAYYTRYSGNTANFGFYGTSVNGTYLGQGGALPVIFYTTNAERMRIDASGNGLLVGMTSFAAVQSGISLYSTNPSVVNVFHANGTATGNGYVAFYYNATYIGGITQNGTTAVTYATSSDYRLKKDVKPMVGALDKVTQLKPVTFTWKSDNTAGQGFIAHELAEVVPDCVVGEKDAVETYTDEEGNEQTRIKPQGIDTSFLVATLTAAIQELTARVIALESK
jgi:hypothetical protein